MSGLSLSQIVEIADRLFPFEAAEPWDNCGIQIGDPNRMVSSIAFGLDPTPLTIDFASRHSCELLITHHPVLIEPIRKIVPDTLTGRTLLAAGSAGVDILSLHTNLDAADGGLNDELAHALGLQEISTPLPAACARLGRLPSKMSLVELARKVSTGLDIPHPRIVCRDNRSVQKVFCATGSGMGYLADARNHGADVMVTGDVRYHAACEALATEMAVIDAGHFGLEKMAARLMAESFERAFRQSGIKVKCCQCDVEKEPFRELSDG